MAITFVTEAHGSSSTASFTTQSGDLCVAFAFTDGTNTAPTLASGWTNITSAGANNCAARIAYKYATGTSTSSGTWTGSLGLQILVYRGAHPSAPIGAFSTDTGSGTIIDIPALTLNNTDGSSAVLLFQGHANTDGNYDNTITGHTTRYYREGNGVMTMGSDDLSSTGYAGQSNSGGGTSGAWRSFAVEVLEDPPPVTGLTATGIATGSPTVGTPSVGQAHGLQGLNATAGVPTVGSPTSNGTNALTATGVATGEPAFTPTAVDGATYALTATGVSTDTPTVDFPDFDSSQDQLEADGLDWYAPTVGAPALGLVQRIEDVSYSVIGGSSGVLPTHAAGDLIVVMAGRAADSSAPVVPSGWTTIATNIDGSVATSLAYKIAASSAESSGTWTNAGRLLVAVYRNARQAGPIGNYGTSSASNTFLVFPAVAQTANNAGSWFAAFVYIRAPDGNISLAPAGMVNKLANSATETSSAIHDTDIPANNFAEATIDIDGTIASWHTYVIEILQEPVAGTTYGLTATGVATAAPTVGTPTAAQSSTTLRILTATSLSTGTPDVGNPTMNVFVAGTADRSAGYGGPGSLFAGYTPSWVPAQYTAANTSNLTTALSLARSYAAALTIRTSSGSVSLASMWSTSGAAYTGAAGSALDTYLNTCLSEKRCAFIPYQSATAYTVIADQRSLPPIFGYGPGLPIINCQNTARDTSIFFGDRYETAVFGVEIQNCAVAIGQANYHCRGYNWDDTSIRDSGALETAAAPSMFSSGGTPARHTTRAGQIIVTGTSGSITSITIRERKKDLKQSAHALTSGNYFLVNLISTGNAITASASTSTTAETIATRINARSGPTGYTAEAIGNRVLIFKPSAGVGGEDTEQLRRAGYMLTVNGTVAHSCDSDFPGLSVNYNRFRNVRSCVSQTSTDTKGGFVTFCKNEIINGQGLVAHYCTRPGNTYAANNYCHDHNATTAVNTYNVAFQFGINGGFFSTRSPTDILDTHNILIENNTFKNIIASGQQDTRTAACMIDQRNTIAMNYGDVSVSFNECVTFKGTTGQEDANLMYGKVIGLKCVGNYFDDFGAKFYQSGRDTDGTEAAGIVYKSPAGGAKDNFEGFTPGRMVISGNTFKNNPDKIKVIYLNYYKVPIEIDGNTFEDCWAEERVNDPNGVQAQGLIHFWENFVGGVKIRGNTFRNCKIGTGGWFIRFHQVTLSTDTSKNIVTDNVAISGADTGTYTGNIQRFYTSASGRIRAGRNTTQGNSHSITWEGTVVTTDVPSAYTYTPEKVESNSGSTMIGNEAAAGVPTTGSAAITQVHNLFATGVDTAAPSTGTPTATQISGEPGTNALGTPTGASTGAPTVGSPTVAQANAMGTPAAIATGAPTVGSPGIDVPVFELEATGVETGVPTVGSPGTATFQDFTAVGVSTPAPVLNTPSITYLTLPGVWVPVPGTNANVWVSVSVVPGVP